MNITKIAEKDAKEYARAQMFYGQGAGVRRRLVEADVFDRAAKVPGYQDAFEKALEKQDWSHHATMAVRERNRIDSGKFLKSNARGLLTGNKQQLTGSVAVAMTVWTVLHQTGLDEPVKAEVKKRYNQAKSRYKTWRLNRKVNKLAETR